MLRTVAREEEVEEVAGTSDNEYWPEPLAWMDDAAATFIPDPCRRSRRDAVKFVCSSYLNPHLDT